MNEPLYLARFLAVASPHRLDIKYEIKLTSQSKNEEEGPVIVIPRDLGEGRPIVWWRIVSQIWGGPGEEEGLGWREIIKSFMDPCPEGERKGQAIKKTAFFSIVRGRWASGIGS